MHNIVETPHPQSHEETLWKADIWKEGVCDIWKEGVTALFYEEQGNSCYCTLLNTGIIKNTGDSCRNDRN